MLWRVPLALPRAYNESIIPPQPAPAELSTESLYLCFAKRAARPSPGLAKNRCALSRVLQAGGLPPTVGCGIASLALTPPFVSALRRLDFGHAQAQGPPNNDAGNLRHRKRGDIWRSGWWGLIQKYLTLGTLGRK